MENKKWWFAFIVLLAIIGILVGCALNEGFKIAVANGLAGTLGVVWTSIVNGWCNLGLIVGPSGTYLAIFALSFAIVGFVGGTLLWRRAVPKAKQVLGMSASTPSTFNPQVAPAVPESAPATAQKNPEKPEATA